MLPELASFGSVGVIAFVVDFVVFNVLRSTVLGDQVLLAKAVSVAVSTVVAWLGNRYLTFRKRRGRPAWREGALFALSNLIGLGIAVGCLFVSHTLLGLTSAVADNISANVVGLVLGTSFRYFAYRTFVFAPTAGGNPNDLEMVKQIS
ncbi:GtrA family protein [Lacisediminihabitans changchengi]|nr:GtrA family protein [Lacisediminihabitans changchengi]